MISSAERRRLLLAGDGGARCGVLDEKGLRQAFEAASVGPDHAARLLRQVVQRGVTDFDDVADLPRRAREVLAKRFAVTSSHMESATTSQDGSTTKMLVRLFDGHLVECVVMRYGQVELQSFPEHLQKRRADGSLDFRSGGRATLCVSSQVGCQMACTFCATGTMGHLANLTAGEILEQLLHANRIEPIRNVVFMGMGEPLDNYEEVMDSVRAMKDVRIFSLSGHHISVSTVGVAPRIRQLAADAPDLSLAVSLHAPRQELRVQLLPAARAWPLDRLMAAIETFVAKQKALSSATGHGRRPRHVLIQYILIRGLNDSTREAAELCELLDPLRGSVQINAIPYNPTDAIGDYKPPTQEAIDAFLSAVRSRGLKITVRQELGQDIGGACGQLVVKAAAAERPAAATEALWRRPGPVFLAGAAACFVLALA